MKNIKFILLALFVAIAVNSCQNEDLTVEDHTLLTEQETIAEEILSDVDALVDEALNLQLFFLKSATVGGNQFLGDCPTITYDKTSTPKVLTIDFGKACTGMDGKIRSGKIIVTSASFENIKTERVKTFENFTVDGKKIEGTISKTITIDREDHSRVAVTKENVTITFPDNGGKAQRKAELTREYQLNSIGNFQDDVITSWGKVEFTRLSGLKVTKTIAEADPLVFKVSCHRLVSGTVTFTTSDNRTWSVDYGDGECDNLATVTNGDKTKVIHLK
jgi:hypothetical protein